MIDLLYILPTCILFGLSFGIVIGFFGFFDFLNPAKNFIAKVLTCEVCSTFWSTFISGSFFILISEITNLRILEILCNFTLLFGISVLNAILIKHLCSFIQNPRKTREKPKKTQETQELKKNDIISAL